MKIIISPAKRMEECQDLFAPGAYPELLEQTKLLYEALKAMEEGELGKLFRANAQITRAIRRCAWSVPPHLLCSPT